MEKEEHPRNVFIGHRCFKSLIASAIEVYNRETNGALIGKNVTRKIESERRKVISVREVYPFQLDRRTPSEVEHGNKAAFRRVIRSMHGMKFDIIGGFHSHPWPYTKIGLSQGDIISITEELKDMRKINRNLKMDKWLEILISIKRKDYNTPQELGWSMFDTGRKVRVLLKTGKYMGYYIIISAYWVLFDKKKPRVKEASVFVPWILE
ncbi:MAG: hypothetical protein JW754_02210 [Candidatus Aenigmarchaeota archaeon]|nr:hypothetical protein [Candidatus Aenigmarchaeota archaeon]